MNLAALRTATRNLVNVFSTDTGATLTDTVLDDFINDAAEQVVLDLAPYHPSVFMTTETISLVADQAPYALTASTWLQVYKVERNVTGQTPKEIEIIDPLLKTFAHNVGEKAAEPKYCYFQGQSIVFVPTPDTDTTDYATVYLIVGEAATIGSGGPTYIPAIAHRLIAYKAAINAGVMYDASTAPYERLYAARLAQVNRLLAGREQQRPRFVRPSIDTRLTTDSRDPAFYDTEWP